MLATARDMGIATVAVYSDPDRDRPFVGHADQAVRLPGDSTADTYLNADRIIAAALASGADAVHPGYGFLSENAAFARACGEAGLIFVGPPPGDRGHGVQAGGQGADGGSRRPRPPRRRGRHGRRCPLGRGPNRLAAPGQGGLRRGGRGSASSPRRRAEAAVGRQAGSRAAFGDATVFVERFVEDPRHIEVQIFGDAQGTVVHLFERECSIQRRYQKIIEESPSPAVGGLRGASPGCRDRGRALGYVGAGTVEFVVDHEGRPFFLEVNTRLQVEHPVTEAVTGLDLVELQLRVAAGEPLPAAATGATSTGHAIEARLYAEDPGRGSSPRGARSGRSRSATTLRSGWTAGWPPGSR